MWAVSYVSSARPLHCHIPISNPTATAPRKSLSQLVVSATNSQPQRHENDNESENENDNDAIGGLGRTILTALQSKPATVPTPEEKPKPKESDGEDGTNQISGSDVLWAMRKVADNKKKKRKMKMMMKKSGGEGRESVLSSVGGRREESGGDCESEIRPLVVKSEWAWKLDQLEKRLNELSQTK